MKRAERRKMVKLEAWDARKKLRDLWPTHRLPGSKRPFHRIAKLLEDAKQAARERMTAMERVKALFNKGFWTNLATVLVPKLEKARRAALESGNKAFSEQDAALLKAGKRLMAYKSRGHGHGGIQARVRILPRSKYQPHQGARECERRLERP
jgi:hypothetical protein